MTTRASFQSLFDAITAFVGRPWQSFPGEPCATAEAEFNSLALPLFEYQYQNVPPYRQFCDFRGVHPGDVDSWKRAPALPTTAFKDFRISSLPPSARTTSFCSSGTTTAARGRHFHDAQSLALYENAVWHGFRPCLLPELAAQPVPTSAERSPAPRCVILTPSPKQAPHSSLVRMFDAIWRRCDGDPSDFLGQTNVRDEWELAPDRILRFFEEAPRSDRPILLLGTAFNYVHLFECLDQTELSLRLPPGSRALETGGYKGRSRSLPKPELIEQFRRSLGLPSGQVVSEYGMSELSSQAYDGTVGPRAGAGSPPRRRFRFLPWARCQIISPETGEPASPGEPGLIQVFDLVNVRSVSALLTGDLGIGHADGFELLGRDPQAEARGCSLLSAA